MIGRLVASAAGMAAAFYLMAAAFAWLRVVRPVPSESMVRRVIPDRAVAWSARSALFTVVVVVQLGLADWTDVAVIAVVIVASLLEFGAGLVSVHAITMASFGHRILALFAAVSIAVGLLILIM